MEKKKVLVMSTLLMAIVLLSVGTIAYFRRTVNGIITGQTGTLVFNVNGLTGETSETLNYSLNRSADDPYVYPDDSGYFDLEITAEGSSTDVYVTLDIIRDNLPDNLKFYTDEEHKVVINKRYFFLQTTEEMNETIRIYWFWDGSVDDINDSLFINETLSARISLTAEPMEYGMMKNAGLEYLNGNSDLFDFFYKIKEITFTNDFSVMPKECTEENLCFDVSYEENQKYPVYAYLTVGTYNTYPYEAYHIYVVCEKTVFAPFDSSFLFYDVDVENINFNNWFNTSLVTNMNSMFDGCNFTSVDTTLFNTSNVTNMRCMFGRCSNFTSLDLSSFDTSKVTDMSGMFYCCMSDNFVTLNLETFDTSNVTNMEAMFLESEYLTSLNLSSFDTSLVTNMSMMFKHCLGLTSLNLNSFDTSSVTNMSEMFAYCEHLTTEITITGNVSNYSLMFEDAAIEEGAKITVNYTSTTSTIVDNMIATKSDNSNVVKGSLKS